MKTNEIELLAVSDTDRAEEGFIDRAEVARRLNRKLRTVGKWMRLGLVPYYKVGGKCVLFRWSEVVARLEERCGAGRRAKTQEINSAERRSPRTQASASTASVGQEAALATIPLITPVQVSRPELVRYVELVRKHGPLVTLPLAGTLLGVSHGHIYRLWTESRLRRVPVMGFQLVALTELVAYARQVDRVRRSE